MRTLICNILTIFPGLFDSPLREGILAKAQANGLLKINILNIRDYTNDKHRVVDDYPYGGGSGMVMKPEPIIKAIKEIKKAVGAGNENKVKVVLMAPQGERLNTKIAEQLSGEDNIILICGRYEGIDERIRLYYCDMELSIGDYVLTGGELPALVLIDAVARFIPGVLGNKDSSREDSFFNNILDYPQYTRPPEVEGYRVPDILLSGNHEEIRKWRREQALILTYLKRRDIIRWEELSEEDRSILEKVMVKDGR